MPPIVKNLLLSKKFVVAMLAAAGAVAMYFGWNVDPAKIALFISPLMIFVGAQGWADSGKEAAAINQSTEWVLQSSAHVHEREITRMQQEHETKMASVNPPQFMSSSIALAAQPGQVSAEVKGSQPGFALLEAMLIIAAVGITAMAALFGMSALVLPAAGAILVAAAALRVRPSAPRVVAVAATLCLSAACSHPGQTTLGVGQCMMDNGVLAEVLAALGKPDYLHQVELVGLSRAPDLVDCALQAVASKSIQPGGSGSGSAQPAAAATSEPMQVDVLALRAREVLATRRAAGK
jgi:hypothetical protein